MEIIIIIGLILLNGIFSMSEIAVVSARKSSLINEAKRGNKRAQSAINLANNPDRFFSTVQVGITLIGIITGLYSGDVLVEDFSKTLVNIGLPATYVYPISKVLIVVIVTYFTIVFGELIPKRIGMVLAEKVAKIIARPMYWLSIISSPFVWILSKSTSSIFNLFKLSNADAKVTEEEIKSMIQEGTKIGEVQVVEQDIVERVFNLGDRNLQSIMTYRGDIVWIDMDMTNDEILDIIRNNPFDKYLVGDKELDHIVGIVYIRDLIGMINDPKFQIKEVLRPIEYFHENMEVYRALEEMKRKHLQYALVCDEFGSLQGIVTLKDILEGLVGNLLDPNEEPQIIQRHDGSFLVDGQCPFYDFLTYFKKGDLYSQNEYNTISGLIIDLLQHIPKTGEIVHWKGLSLEIVDMDGTRIDKVLVQPDSNK